MNQFKYCWEMERNFDASDALSACNHAQERALNDFVFYRDINSPTFVSLRKFIANRLWERFHAATARGRGYTTVNNWWEGEQA